MRAGKVDFREELCYKSNWRTLLRANCQQWQDAKSPVRSFRMAGLPGGCHEHFKSWFILTEFGRRCAFPAGSAAGEGCARPDELSVPDFRLRADTERAVEPAIVHPAVGSARRREQDSGSLCKSGEPPVPGGFRHGRGVFGHLADHAVRPVFRECLQFGAERIEPESACLRREFRAFRRAFLDRHHGQSEWHVVAQYPGFAGRAFIPARAGRAGVCGNRAFRFAAGFRSTIAGPIRSESSIAPGSGERKFRASLFRIPVFQRSPKSAARAEGGKHPRHRAESGRTVQHHISAGLTAAGDPRPFLPG